MLIISKELRDELVKREQSFVLILPKVLNPLYLNSFCRRRQEATTKCCLFSHTYYLIIQLLLYLHVALLF